MRRLITAALAVVLLTVAVIGGSALAFFSTKGSGTASAAVTNLTAPTISSATAAAGGTVTVSWGKVTPPGSGTVSYYVTRDGGVAGGNCPTEAEPTTVLTCKDTEVGIGEHSYKVIAVWETWTATSAVKTAKVTIGEVVKFTISGSTTTPATGAAVNLTITAKDVNNATVTSYAESHNFVFAGGEAAPNGAVPTVVNSGGSTINFGSATALTFTSGVASVSASKNGVLKVYDAGPASITATSEGMTTPTPLNLTVSPTASKFVIEGPSSSNAGQTIDTTITALDAYNNVATPYEGSKSLTFAGASASVGSNIPTVTNSSGTAVNFGTATAIKFTAGVADSSEGSGGKMVLYKAAAATISATATSMTTLTSLTVTTSPLAASKLALGSSTSTPTAGTGFNITTTAQDTYGNTATTYTGAHSVTFSGATNSPNGNVPTVVDSAGTVVNFGTATALTFTAGVATPASSKNGFAKLYKTGATSVTASAGAIATATGLSLTVGTTVSKFVFEGPTTSAAGATIEPKISATDSYENLVTSYEGSKSLTFAGASASAGGNTPTVTNSSGTAVNFGTATAIKFTAGVADSSEGSGGKMVLYKAAAATISATATSMTTLVSMTVTTSPLAASKLALGSGSTATAGTGFNVTTTAQDTYGNTATTYTGAHNITFSGAGASPTGTQPTVVNSAGAAVNFSSATALTFTAGVATPASSKNGFATLYKAGATSINATDGTLSTTVATSVTVSNATTSRVAVTGLTSSAGSIESNCVLTCTVTALGNSGTVKAKASATDAYGNIASGLGSTKSVTVTATGGSIAGSPLSIASTGTATSGTEFTYTAPSSGSFTNTITLAISGYTSATVTVSK